MTDFVKGNRNRWLWTMVIMQPEWSFPLRYSPWRVDISCWKSHKQNS